jgi:hypothetical protein
VGLSLFTDHLLQQSHVLPGWGQPVWNPWLNLLGLSYRCAFTVCGCYLTARLAGRNPMLHALLLGALGLFFSLLGTWTTIQNHFGPVWYPIALATATLPCAWLGGFLAESRAD